MYTGWFTVTVDIDIITIHVNAWPFRYFCVLIILSGIWVYRTHSKESSFKIFRKTQMVVICDQHGI